MSKPQLGEVPVNGTVEAEELAPEFELDKLFADDTTITRYLAAPSKAYPQGVWVRFKRSLSYGESTAVEAALFQGMKAEELVDLADRSQSANAPVLIADMRRQKLMNLAMWIDDWNFPGPDGKTVKWPKKLGEKFQIVSGLRGKVGAWLEAQIQDIAAEAGEVLVAEASSPDGENPLVLRAGGGGPS